MIQIQKDDNWDGPEGTVPAVLREIRVTEKIIGGKMVTTIRPVFQLTSMCSPRFNYVVGKNYPLTDPNKFKADFENWLGDKFYDLADANGKISREALESLIGRQADLHVVHIHNDNHKAPFCHVATIAPSGTLTDLN